MKEESRSSFWMLLAVFVVLAFPALPVAADDAPPGHGSPDSPHGHPGHHDDATVSHRFSDAEAWARRFDDPSRAEWQKPEELVVALAIEAGSRVADIGAGTGYFEAHLARAVGPSGVVFAVDVEPNLVEHLRARAEREETPNVVPVLGSFDNPRLPPAGVDFVLIVDTYHHINDRIDYFRRLKEVLAPGGRVAIVDFEKRPIPVGPGMDHKLDKAVFVEEMRLAGLELSGDLDDVLPYQYVLVFQPGH